MRRILLVLFASAILADLALGAGSYTNFGSGGVIHGADAAGTNVAGGDSYIDGGKGTGNAAGGTVHIRVAPAGSSGSSQNGLADAVTIDSTKKVSFAAAAAAGNCHLDPTPIAVTCSSTSNLDLSSSAVFFVTLTGACTITVSNPASGCGFVFEFSQDATGGRTLTLPASFGFTATPTFSTTANKTDVLTGYYNASVAKFRLTATIGY
jgi:hypothetical protein